MRPPTPPTPPTPGRPPRPPRPRRPPRPPRPRRRRSPPDPERRLLIRAQRRLTLQVTGGCSLVIALVGVLLYGVTISGQDAAARRDLATATRGASVAHPPPSVWVYELRGEIVHRSAGAPPTPPAPTAMYLATANGRVLVTRTDAYLVRTERRGDVVLQTAFDLRFQTAERHRIRGVLAATLLAGPAAALLTGQVLARRAIAPLGEALAHRGRFVADAGHELRTPLTRLHTRAQLVSREMRRTPVPFTLTEEMDRLVTGTRQLGEVVEDLLSSRFERAHRPYRCVDLAALAAETAEAARALAHGVTIGVRAGPGAHVVRGAEPALRRVVSALLDNALAHTRPGGHIQVTLSSDPAGVRLTVRDDGTGLDPRTAERLFTRHAGGSPRGFGLGLALAREVVDGHGGTITAGGRPGAGAVFTVRLPAAPPASRP